ncbi:hypothetical protein BDC45DRAFT_572241 [Circinella umbellata]|nr:hypothetical protein BDC45DRAFT_572241 [Circinella umbellata]
MKAVEGSKVQEGYCVLSYSWNQPGDIIKNEMTGNSDHIDQDCISRKDKQQRSEVRQMHKIYSNAYCTIAFVPELTAEIFYPRANCPIRKDFVWGQLHYFTLCSRTHSTKEHDHVFALAKILPEIMKKITVDYDQDIPELIIQFYGLLAKKDLRIYGEHWHWSDYDRSFKNYTVNGRALKITCGALTNDKHHSEILDLESIKDILSPFPQEYSNFSWSFVIRLQPQKSTNEKLIEVHGIRSSEPDSTDYERIAIQLNNLSHFTEDPR